MPGLLALFAHPDDETYRCGGTLALLARRGVHVQVITATRGEAGSCGDPPLCQPAELEVTPEARQRLFLGTEHLQRAVSRAPHDVFASLPRTSAA